MQLNEMKSGVTYKIVSPLWFGAEVTLSPSGSCAVLLKQSNDGFPNDEYLGKDTFDFSTYGKTIAVAEIKEEATEEESVLMSNVKTGALYKIVGDTIKGLPRTHQDSWVGAIIFLTKKGGYLLKQSVKGYPDKSLINSGTICFSMNSYGNKLLLVPYTM